MTEQSPEPRAPRDPAEPDLIDPAEPEIAPMPRWVPVLIGAVLAIIAALAVFTGLRYRNNSLGEIVGTEQKAEPVQPTAPAPPGEPGAGASRVMPGEQDAIPTANAPVTGEARAVITGGPGGVTATIRIWARRGMVFNVLPETAMVYVNDLPIGEVSQFNSMDEVYDFAATGSYTVRLVAEGYRERQFVVTAAEDAKQEVARISLKMERQ
jgi:hypothetical protein